MAYHGLPKYTFYRHPNNHSAWTTDHSKLTPETLIEYLDVYRARTKWLSAQFPGQADTFQYFEWSFMISMVEKINRFRLLNCEQQREDMEAVLSENRFSFIHHPLIQPFERIWMDRYVDQTKYYFRHKTHGKLFIKNVDVALNGEDEKELFFSLLSDYADRIYIEKIANLFSTIDYKNIIQKDEGINRYGEKLYKAQVCAFPFYYLLIFPNGDIRPCTNIISSARLGNVYSDTLVRVWNGKMRQAFLKMQLEHRRFLHCL